MGATLTWRELPERENRTTEKIVEFGKRSSACRGLMVASDRVGPGVVLVPGRSGPTESAVDIARYLNAEGFTVVVPEMDGPVLPSEQTMPKLAEAASFLTDNWHPRLGIVGLWDSSEAAVALALETGAEGVVVHYSMPALPEAMPVPLLAHLVEPPAAQASDADVEWHGYDAAPGFVEDGSSEENAGQALARTAEFFHYLLS